MKITLTTAVLSALIASTASAQYSGYTDAIHSPEIIEINPAALPTTYTRGVQVSYNRHETATLAATQNANGNTTWSGSQRQAMGAQDAPARILVRAFDGVFSIDPFVPLPQGRGEDLTNLLFFGTTLETNRTYFGTERIQRVERLMQILETARHNWLQANGYFGVKSFTSSNATTGNQPEASLPEPAASFRIPADAPRGKSREQVNSGDSNARSIASNLLSGDEPIRISLPFGTAPDVVASVQARNAQNTQETEELASND